MRSKETITKQNEYNRQKYDHFNLMLPKGQKAVLQEEAKRRGLSLNALIQEAINKYINCTE